MGLPTITLCLTDACNLNCCMQTEGHRCAAGAKDHNMDTVCMLDIPQALLWIKTHFSGSPVHFSGGEPFLHPGIEQGLRSSIDMGFDTTVFTNSTLLRSNPWCYDLPLKWCLSHHRGQVPLKEFLWQIGPLRSRPHIVTRINPEFRKEFPDQTHVYPGFTFKWVVANHGYHECRVLKSEVDPCPNNGIILIGTQGEVYACSQPSIAMYGNVKDCSFDREAASRMRCPHNMYPWKCHTWQNAQLFSELL